MEIVEGLRGRGHVWVVDAHDCDPSALRRLMAAIVGGLGLHPLGRPKLLRFPGTGGVAALWMLRDSHLAIHTFPERASACVDLFCCRPVRKLE